jgi:D-3-phosphoglycerate dehydrogenase
MSIRVLIADAISNAGVDLLRSTPGFEVTVRTGLKGAELAAALVDHQALLVRSATQVTAAVLASPGALQVIGRAGTGVDNIDIAAATHAGVVVINTPGGNSVAAAELAFAHLLALARHVPQANADLRAGIWERKKYTGVELAGKTLGVVGLGRIGREVARRAAAFRMDVLAFDPFVSQKAAADLGVETAALNELLARADFVTLHMPLSGDTRHLLDRAALARMKRGARLINCARGGLVDEAALLEAIESGRLAGAALDVFEDEPPRDRRLVEDPRVVSTPHLGASTVEAQERVGTEIAEKVRDFFLSGVILDAVNFPAMSRDDHAAARPVMDLAERMGRFAAQAVEGGVTRLVVRGFGAFAERPLAPLTMAAVKGLLAPALEHGVTFVNALELARARGITVEDGRSNEATEFSSLLRLTVETDHERLAVSGTLIAGRPRIVEIDGLSIETHPDGHLLLLKNRDVPGVVGRIGTVLGHAGVNIAAIHLGRAAAGGEAVSILSVDGPAPAEALAALRALDDVVRARAVTI